MFKRRENSARQSPETFRESQIFVYFGQIWHLKEKITIQQISIVLAKNDDILTNARPSVQNLYTCDQRSSPHGLWQEQLVLLHSLGSQPIRDQETSKSSVRTTPGVDGAIQKDEGRDARKHWLRECSWPQIKPLLCSDTIPQSQNPKDKGLSDGTINC